MQSLASREAPITWVNRKVTDQELWAEYEAASLAVLPYNQSFGDHGGPSSVLLEVLGADPQVAIPGWNSVTSSHSDCNDRTADGDRQGDRSPDPLDLGR